MRNWVRVAVAASALVALSGCGVFKGSTKKTPVIGQRVPILASENEIVADKTLDGVEVLLPDAATNDSWGQPGGNAAKSMGQLTLGTSLTQAWRAEIPGTSKTARLGAGDAG